jgi:hypothetical protein
VSPSQLLNQLLNFYDIQWGHIIEGDLDVIIFNAVAETISNGGMSRETVIMLPC